MGPILGAIADYRAMKKRLLASVDDDRRRRHAADGHDRERRVACTRPCSSWSATSASPRAWCSTTRCCRTWRGRTNWTASRPPGSRWASSAAASCCWSTSRGFSAPPTFGLPSTLAAIKLSFASVAVWWFVFTIPLLRTVPEPPASLESDETGREPAIRAAFTRVIETFRELRAYRQAFLMLLAFLLYNDGIQTIIRMASIYGAEVGIDRNAQIAAFVHGAVRRRPVLVCVRRDGRPHRRQTGPVPGPCGLRRHLDPRLLHALDLALLRAGLPGRARSRAESRRSAARSSRG